MTDNIEFEKAIEAIRAGDNAVGQRILIGILKTNPKNELAWLWLSRALPDKNQRIAALEQCLKVNPNSEIARRALSQLQKQPSRRRPEHTSSGRDERLEKLADSAVSHPAAPPPSQTPLRDRLEDRGNLASRVPSGRIGASFPSSEAGSTAKSKRRPRGRRTFGPLEIGLVLLVLVALVSLAYVYFVQNQNVKFDLVAQAELATESTLETENAGLRTQVSQRQTQAAAPSNTPTVTLDVTATPQTSLTSTSTTTPAPSQTPLPDWIEPENFSDLVVDSEFEGQFFGNLAFSSEGGYLAASSSNMIQVWTADSWSAVYQLDLDSRATALSFSEFADRLFYAQVGLGNESFINSISVDDWTIDLSGVRSTNPIAQILSTQDDDILVIGLVATTSNVNFFSLLNNSMLSSVEHPDGLIVMDINPSTGFLATGGYDDWIRIWDPVSYQSVATLTGFVSDITALTFSSDGTLLAAASREGEIRVWDANTWRLLERQEAHDGEIVKLVFSENDQMLLTAGADGLIIAWDIETYEKLAEIMTPIGLSDLEFSSNGEALAVSNETMIRIYTLPDS